MEELITGLANTLNFSVVDQYIMWENYTIAVSNIAVFSTGISTKYHIKNEKKGILHTLAKGVSMIFPLAIMMDENVPVKRELLESSLHFLINDTDLPCINLELSNGVKMEITFSDMLTFSDSVYSVKKAILDHTKLKNLEMHGTDILIDGANFHEKAFFIEEVEK